MFTKISLCLSILALFSVLLVKPTYAADSCIVETDPKIITENSSLITLTIYYDQLIKGKSYSFGFVGGNKSDFQVSDTDPRYIKVRVSTGVDPNYPDEKVFDAVTGREIIRDDIIRFIKNRGTYKFSITEGFFTSHCTGEIKVVPPFICTDLQVTDNKNFDLGDTVGFTGKINQDQSFFFRAYDAESTNKEGVTIDNFVPDNGLYSFTGSYTIPEGKPGTWTLKGYEHGAFGLDGYEIKNCSLQFGVDSEIVTPPPEDCPSECASDINNCQTKKDICGNCSFCPSSDEPYNPGREDLCDPIKGELENQECINCVGYEGGIWTALGCIRTDLSGFVDSFFKVGLGVSGGIAFLFLVYGAFLIITSAGNPETIQHAREVITSAITGILLIIFAVLIIQIFAINILRIPGFGPRDESTMSEPKAEEVKPSSTPTPTPKKDATELLDDIPFINYQIQGLSADNKLPKQGAVTVAVTGNVKDLGYNLLMVTYTNNTGRNLEGVIADCKQVSEANREVTLNLPTNSDSYLVTNLYRTYRTCSSLPANVENITTSVAISHKTVTVSFAP